jgi:signal recognition particle receptor subunit beta
MYLQEARSALHECMSDPAMPDYAPVIILANKQDIHNAATPEQISQHLDIFQLGRYLTNSNSVTKIRLTNS